MEEEWKKSGGRLDKARTKPYKTQITRIINLLADYKGKDKPNNVLPYTYRVSFPARRFLYSRAESSCVSLKKPETGDQVNRLRSDLGSIIRAVGSFFSES